MVCTTTPSLMPDVKESTLPADQILLPCQSVYPPQSCRHLCWQLIHLQESLAATREELQALNYTNTILTPSSSSAVNEPNVMKRYSYSPLMQLTFKALSYLVWLVIGLAIALSLTHILDILPITNQIIGFVAMLLKPLVVIVLGLIAITVFKESL